MRTKIILLTIVSGCLALLLSSCAHLQPGADPIVVRAEQSLTVAQATFDTFLKLDNADRELVKAKAPEVHRFAEWLREPQPISPGSSTIVARWAALVESADQVKLVYKNHRTPENKASLITALATLDTVIVQVEADLAQLKTINP